MERLEIERSQNARNVQAQTEMYKQKISKRLEQIKREVVSTNQQVVARRSLYHKQVLENLRAKTDQIYSKHNEVTTKINKDAIRRDVNVRVNRGLESLEELVSLIRLSSMSESAINDAIYDPAISSTYGEKIRRFSISGFIKSIQQHLIEQTEFINIAAHELRTPIMPILVNAEILEQELGEREEVRAIMRNALRLQILAQNILDVARLNAGSFPLKKRMFDLHDLICEIVEDETSRLKNGNLRLDHSRVQSIEIVADRDRIAQVLFNLLGNAIKFTENGSISITAERTEGHVIVNIRDNGPGIDTQIFPILFSRFTKNSHTGTGIGLGLYVSKSIVEAHGGTISARNNDAPDKGSTFSFVLPLSEKPGLSESEEHGSSD